MANAQVTLDLDRPHVPMTLSDAPKCQYLEDMTSGGICFVHGAGGQLYVRYLSSLRPKCCRPGTMRANTRVRVLKPGEVISVTVVEVGYPEHQKVPQ